MAGLIGKLIDDDCLGVIGREEVFVLVIDFDLEGRGKRLLMGRLELNDFDFDSGSVSSEMVIGCSRLYYSMGRVDQVVG